MYKRHHPFKITYNSYIYLLPENVQDLLSHPDNIVTDKKQGLKPLYTHLRVKTVLR